MARTFEVIQGQRCVKTRQSRAVLTDSKQKQVDIVTEMRDESTGNGERGTMHYEFVDLEIELCPQMTLFILFGVNRLFLFKTN